MSLMRHGFVSDLYSGNKVSATFILNISLYNYFTRFHDTISDTSTFLLYFLSIFIFFKFVSLNIRSILLIFNMKRKIIKINVHVNVYVFLLIIII